jgi:pSer/pThr/pTyr-binding forkhead associated (FHA) protein
MYIFSFWGPMRSRNGKILNYNRGVGLQGIFGTYAGHTIYLHSGVVTIGSGAGVTIPIHDPYVSARHCLVRFNTKTGNYEIYDSSQNGVYLETGQKLTKGMYNALQRGTVIWIGSNTQKFKLL